MDNPDTDTGPTVRRQWQRYLPAGHPGGSARAGGRAGRQYGSRRADRFLDRSLLPPPRQCRPLGQQAAVRDKFALARCALQEVCHRQVEFTAAEHRIETPVTARLRWGI